MALVGNKGTYTALQKVQPWTTDIGEKVETGMKRAEERIARGEAEQAAEKAKKSAITKKFGTDYATLVDVITNTKSIDEAYIRGLGGARDMLGDVYKGIEKNPALADDINTQMKIGNLKNFSKNLKLVSDRYTKYATTVTKGMQDGTLSDWNKNVLSDLDSVFRQANLDVKVDKETGLPIAVIAVLDDDGNPTGELKELNLLEILDGRGLNDTVNTFDFEESVTNIGGKLGKREVKTPSGFSHIEYQKFEDIEKDVRTMVVGFIGNDTNSTDVAKSIWSDMMAEDPKKLDKVDMKRIEDFYVASIKGFYDEKNKKTTDFGAIETRRKTRKTEEKEKGLGLQLRTDEQEKPLREGLIGVGGDIGGPAYSFTLPKDVTLGVKGEKNLIDNLFLTDSGKIAYSGRSFKGKASGLKVDANDYLSETYSGQIIVDIVDGGLSVKELNDIARDLGYPNTGALKRELIRVRDQAIEGTEKIGIDTSKYN